MVNSSNEVAIIVVLIFGILLVLLVIFVFVISGKRRKSIYMRGIEFVPLLIHLPPAVDDVNANGRDERDVVNEAISRAQSMYSIIASTVDKGFQTKIIGQSHFSFEIISTKGNISFYVFAPKKKVDVVKQAILSAYPTAIIEKGRRVNFFSKEVGMDGIAGTELRLKKDFIYPINTYEDMKKDASLAIFDSMAKVKEDEGIGVQILFRPTGDDWIKKSTERVKKIKEGKTSSRMIGDGGSWAQDALHALVRPPEDHSNQKIDEMKPLSDLELQEIKAIEDKTRNYGFETLIRIVASSKNKNRSEMLLGGVLTAFSQFDSANYNGFRVDAVKDVSKVTKNYVLRAFPVKEKNNILNSVEMASIFHLPQQNAIATSQVERQQYKQVDGPAKLAESGLLLGENEYRGEKKKIYLDEDNRRRHLYMIGQTGSGKSVFLENLAYQDMMAGRGFAFIDPHGDAVEALLKRVPQDRIDDIIYFDPADIEHPVGMNMFEFTNPDQIDFIVQEGINMLQSLFDPQNQGMFGPRGQHMFRNAALLLMSDPNGATFIDIPKCFTDVEFVKEKLKYVTDRAVFDYWTKEFPASQKSNDAGEVITWFSSKWGPFLANTMMRNILGQTKSGFNIREIMDNKKIFLVNLSKGRVGEVNSKLLGMILVMKIQQAAMSRADTPEEQRKDFCLYVDEFQNFATESFESILSEARKYRLNLIVANQFMTQLTDKIREAILGNVGTILSGRLGVTDAELMVKAFSPVFTTDDLMKQPNYSVICKVMMFGMPSSPFTMKFLPPMGEPNEQLMNSLKEYSAVKYAKTRAEVGREIEARWTKNLVKNELKDEMIEEKVKEEKLAIKKENIQEKKNEQSAFLRGWQKRKEETILNRDESKNVSQSVKQNIEQINSNEGIIRIR